MGKVRGSLTFLELRGASTVEDGLNKVLGNQSWDSSKQEAQLPTYETCGPRSTSELVGKDPNGIFFLSSN